jgi:hypothetical protein
MEGKVAQSKQGEDLGATYPPGSISVGHYEAVFDMTTQMLAVPSIEERALLALDTLTECRWIQPRPEYPRYTTGGRCG